MISNLRLELASRSDAVEISALSRAEIEHGLRPTWSQQRVLHSIRNPDTNVAVARDGSRFLGFGIMEYGDDRAHLALLAVREDSRRKGVGTALLDWLEKSALTAGILVVRAEVRGSSRDARSFYLDRGYAEGERLEGYYQAIEDAVRLERRLGV